MPDGLAQPSTREHWRMYLDVDCDYALGFFRDGQFQTWTVRAWTNGIIEIAEGHTESDSDFNLAPSTRDPDSLLDAVDAFMAAIGAEQVSWREALEIEEDDHDG